VRYHINERQTITDQMNPDSRYNLKPHKRNLGTSIDEQPSDGEQTGGGEQPNDGERPSANASY
jgi:hypothetical protein